MRTRRRTQLARSLVMILGALLVVSGAGFAAARTMTGAPWKQPVLSAMGPCDTTEDTTTEAPDATETEAPEATETEVAEATETEAPEATETEVAEATETEAPDASDTGTPDASETEVPDASETEAPDATETESPEPTETETPDATETESPEPTETETPDASETESPEATEKAPTTVDCADDTDSADSADTKAVFVGDCGSAALGETRLTGSSTDADTARAFDSLAEALSSGQRDHMVQSIRVLMRNCEAHPNDGLRNALYHHGLNWLRHYDHELWLQQKFADKWADGKPGGGHDATTHGKPDKSDKTHDKIHGNPHDADPSWAPGGGSSSSHGNGNGNGNG